MFFWKKYTSGPRYWNVPVLVNTGTFLVYQYCPKMWYWCSLEHAGGIQKQTILKRKNGLVLSNTCVPVSGTWSTLFPIFIVGSNSNKNMFIISQVTTTWCVVSFILRPVLASWHAVMTTELASGITDPMQTDWSCGLSCDWIMIIHGHVLASPA